MCSFGIVLSQYIPLKAFSNAVLVKSEGVLLSKRMMDSIYAGVLTKTANTGQWPIRKYSKGPLS